MSLRPDELEAIARELDERVRGAFVQKAFAPLPRVVFLELRQPGRTVRLCLSAEPGVARLSVARERPPSPEEPAGFQRWLRKELIGAKLERVEVIAPLVVRLWFDHHGLDRRLVADLRGSGANLFLLDGADRLLGASVPAPHLRPGATLTFEAHPAAPKPSPGDERLRPDPAADFPLAEAAEALYGARESSRRAQEIRRRLTAPLKARLKRLEGTLAKVEAEMNRGEEIERHRAMGELLAQNLFRFQQGQRTARLTRYTETGAEEIEVTIDPRRTAREEADWHFHQYRRLAHGVEHAKRRHAELSLEREQLRDELRAIEAMDDAALLEEVDVLSARRHGGPVRGKPYKEYVAVNGARIRVGRSSEDNDTLTFRIARPYDWWLHARGVPGSHVILEGTRNQPPDSEALVDAAHLAHQHSNLKSEPRGEIAWTQVKYVKKQKGGAPGQVTFTRDRTLVVRIEPERLERLNRSRTDL
ncbi:MAG: DUF814 domain-containing protein [Myxococcaceae bacterium]|nr:DUF814 domain-containing protein [Myxococcaceae bacterium]